MAQQPNRGGFNPNAQSFVPNANAQPFVPGQRFASNAQQYPTGYPSYQMGGYPYAQGNPMMWGQSGQMPPMGNWQQPPQQPQQPSQTQPTQPQVTQQQAVPQQPAQGRPMETAPQPAESWDDGSDVPAPEPPKPPVKAAAPPKEVQKPEKVEPPPPKEDKPKEKPNKAEIDEALGKYKAVQLNIEEFEKTRKEHLNIVFIGHVDAGKSTIGGQLMYLTGMVDKRTLEKYEREAKEKGRESWYLSWALDTNDEEREKGKTVEVGRAYFETEKKHFAILDAPGHKSFVPNMISGATQADLAVLVISARKGEFETGFDRGGQTREHAMLVKTAGVKHLIVLVNKMDDPTVNYDEERYTEIQGKLTPYLRKVGFNPKTDITYIPCSGLTGAFLKDRPDSAASWYTGPCFLEFIDGMTKISRDYGGPVRMIVCDKYSDMGTMIIGKMESGAVQKGQTLILMPNKVSVQVLQCICDEDEVDQVVAGDNVKLKLKGVEENDILPGFIICSPDSICRVGKVFDAEVVILEHKSIISSGYSCVLHLHSAVEEVSVQRIICTINKKTGAKERSRFVKQDEKCIMRIESSEAFCLDTFKEFPVMGRFTLRDEGRTIGIGKVVKVLE